MKIVLKNKRNKEGRRKERLSMSSEGEKEDVHYNALYLACPDIARVR